MRDFSQLIDRLENCYSFRCEAGPLKNCVEWQELKKAISVLLLPGLQVAARISIAKDEHELRVPIDLRIKRRIEEIKKGQGE